MSKQTSKRIAKLQEEYNQELAKFHIIRMRIMTDMLAIAPTIEEDKFKWDK
jgi:hypothetical protein